MKVLLQPGDDWTPGVVCSFERPAGLNDETLLAWISSQGLPVLEAHADETSVQVRVSSQGKRTGDVMAAFGMKPLLTRPNHSSPFQMSLHLHLDNADALDMTTAVAIPLHDTSLSTLLQDVAASRALNPRYQLAVNGLDLNAHATTPVYPIAGMHAGAAAEHSIYQLRSLTLLMRDDADYGRCTVSGSGVITVNDAQEVAVSLRPVFVTGAELQRAMSDLWHAHLN